MPQRDELGAAMEIDVQSCGFSCWFDTATRYLDPAIQFINTAASFLTSVAGVLTALLAVVGATAAFRGKKTVTNTPVVPIAADDGAATPDIVLLPQIDELVDRNSRQLASNRWAAVAFATAVIAAAIYFIAPPVIAVAASEVPQGATLALSGLGLLLCGCWLLERKIDRRWLRTAADLRPSTSAFWLRGLFIWAVPIVVVLVTIYLSADAIRGLSRIPDTSRLSPGSLGNAIVALAVAVSWLLDRQISPVARATSAEARLDKLRLARSKVLEGIAEYKKDRHGTRLSDFTDIARKAIERASRAEAENRP